MFLSLICGFADTRDMFLLELHCLLLCTLLDLNMVLLVVYSCVRVKE